MRNYTLIITNRVLAVCNTVASLYQLERGEKVVTENEQ